MSSRRRSIPKGGPPEHVFHYGLIDEEICEHRVVRKTATLVYVEAWCRRGADGPVERFIRAKLEGPGVERIGNRYFAGWGSERPQANGTQEGTASNTHAADESWARTWNDLHAEMLHAAKVAARNAAFDAALRAAAMEAMFPWLKVLGLPFPFSAMDVRIAWRREARKTHPDAGGDTRQFILAKNAYDHAIAYLARGR